MVNMERMVSLLSSRLDNLLSAEKSAMETVEEAERRARGIRTAVPGEISAIEEEYEAELVKYEKKGLETVQEELEELKSSLEGTLSERKKRLEDASTVLAPRALELIRKAVEGERT